MTSWRSFADRELRDPGRDHRHRGRRRRAQRDADDRRGRRALRPCPTPPVARPRRAREGKSVCLLLRGPVLSETGRARLALMRETNDGFRIAEEDLRLRGPGEILGTRQSGEAGVPPRQPRAGRRAGAARPERRATAARSRRRPRRPARPGGAGLLYLFERDAAVGLLRSSG